MDGLSPIIVTALNELKNDEISELYSYLLNQENAASEIVIKLIGKLTSDEAKLLVTPLSNKRIFKVEKAFQVAPNLSPDAEPQPAPPQISIAIRRISEHEMLTILSNMGAFYLHASIEIDCYYFHSIYTYKAFTTVDPKGKTPKKVDVIKFKIRKSITHETYEKLKKETDEFVFVDKISGAMNTCGSSKLTASATIYKQEALRIFGHHATEEVYLDF